ncbi:MAG: hypothetical protein ACT4OU_08165 [Hyphomicrobium sp.]
MFRKVLPRLRLRRKLALVAAAMLPAAVAIAQTVEPAPQQAAPTDAAIPSLMFFTLGIGLILGLGALALFLSKRSNREATERVLNPNHPSNQ